MQKNLQDVKKWCIIDKKAFIGNIEGDKMKVSIISKIIIFMVLIVTISNIPIFTYAVTIDDVIDSGKSFLDAGGGETGAFGSDGEEELKGISDFVSGVLLTIALGVTLISGVVMGMNFMFQSVEDKAKIKESMIPWIIGIFISFGAFGIWQITMTIFESFN